MTEDTTTSSSASTQTPGSGNSIVLFAVVGIIAGALGVLTIVGIGERFRLPRELAILGIGGPPGAEDQAKIVAGNVILKYKHSALWMGAAAAVWGGLFCLAKTFVNPTAGNRIAATVSGIACGAVIGAIAGLTSNYVDIWILNNIPRGQLTPPEHMPFILHGITWLLMGAAVGLGFGIAFSRKNPAELFATTVVTAIAAALGGILYPLLSAFILPAANVTQAIPDGLPDKFLWMEVPALLIGLALGRRK